SSDTPYPVSSRRLIPSLRCCHRRRDTGCGTAMRHLTVVLGSNNIGSAVACALRSVDAPVVVIDEVDPSWPYRGMSLTDAWFTGTASLGGHDACFCASARSVPIVLARGMIAATTWSWRG